MRLRVFAGVAVASLVALSGAQSVSAAAVVFDPTARVTVNNLGGGSARIVNGVFDASYFNAPAAASALTPDGYTVTADAGSIHNGVATAYASLHEGKLRARAVPGISPTGSLFAISDAQFYDTLYFNNTSGSAQQLSFRLAFDGDIATTQTVAPTMGGFVQMQLSVCGACGNNLAQLITYLDGAAVGAAITANFSQAGVTNFNNFGSPINPAHYSFGATLSGTRIDGFAMTTLSIPTGMTSLGIGARLYLDCRDAGFCDFGNTGSFALGALPDGVSFTSQSGVLLQGIGGVPEPTTWALLILGFGAVGATLRHRTRRPTRVLA